MSACYVPGIESYTKAALSDARVVLAGYKWMWAHFPFKVQRLNALTHLPVLTQLVERKGDSNLLLPLYYHSVFLLLTSTSKFISLLLTQNSSHSCFTEKKAWGKWPLKEPNVLILLWNVTEKKSEASSLDIVAPVWGCPHECPWFVVWDLRVKKKSSFLEEYVSVSAVGHALVTHQWAWTRCLPVHLSF